MISALFGLNVVFLILGAGVAEMNSKLSLFAKVMDQVYSPFTENWKPKAFKENKSHYLWTDAFGVCNYLTLYIESQQERYLEQAKTLIDVVHGTLGKSRDGLTRLGNSTDDEPLLGGLRIGKPQAEGPSMQEDGQYFHYLTKWMFALNRMTIVTKDPKYNHWAIQMAKHIHPHFVKDGGLTARGGKRMFWKLSIDLQRPLVPSEGGLDPYDGYTTYKILQSTEADNTVLSKEIADMRSMVDARYKEYTTDDCLDAGEALWLSSWFPQEAWSQILCRRAGEAVNFMWKRGEFAHGDKYRLAFREFGTTIGVQMHPELWEAQDWKSKVDSLHNFWQERLYDRDADITPIMFCTSLVPGIWSKDFCGS